MHVVLLGDSIFDNAAYTGGGPDVLHQVRELLGAGQRASLLAVDGATTADVQQQLRHLPSDASQLVLSVGGNDALRHINVLNEPAESVPQVVRRLADISIDFEDKYRRGVEVCVKVGLPLVLCSIYDGCFPDPDFQRLASTVLTVFNDVIFRVGIEHRLCILDLRFVCSSPSDYANPIEPSSVGGEKIARAIVRLVSAGESQRYGAQIVVS